MDNLYVIIVGYISGALIGGFFYLALLVYGYFYVNDNAEITDQEQIMDVREFILPYYEESTFFFSLSFLLGFLSGMGVFAKSVN